MDFAEAAVDQRGMIGTWHWKICEFRFHWKRLHHGLIYGLVISNGISAYGWFEEHISWFPTWTFSRSRLFWDALTSRLNPMFPAGRPAAPRGKPRSLEDRAAATLQADGFSTSYEGGDSKVTREKPHFLDIIFLGKALFFHIYLSLPWCHFWWFSQSMSSWSKDIKTAWVE